MIRTLMHFSLLPRDATTCLTPPKVMNAQIYRRVQKADAWVSALPVSQKRENKVARMMITIVAVFVICHTLRFFINMYEFVQKERGVSEREWPDWIQTAIAISHLLFVVNSSVNFLIYNLKDKDFFEVFKSTLWLSRRQTASGTRCKRTGTMRSRVTV